ncbi:hypothetical protein ACWD01_33175 [Streptomyces sp. NPDC002835]
MPKPAGIRKTHTIPQIMVNRGGPLMPGPEAGNPIAGPIKKVMGGYQFVRDRQDDLRDEQHPDGHDAYVESWRDAHKLSQEYATAVHAGNTDEARRLLEALMAMADQWKSHPDFPAATRAVRAVHGADTTAER